MIVKIHVWFGKQNITASESCFMCKELSVFMSLGGEQRLFYNMAAENAD